MVKVVKICIIGFSIFSALLSLALIVLFLYILRPNECKSGECLRAALEIITSIDTKLDPCDNFYKFSCAIYMNTTNIAEDQTRVDDFSQIEDTLNENLNTIFKTKPTENDPKFFHLPYNLYNGCMNRVLLEKKGNEPINKIMHELGGWPIIEGDKWKEDSWEWQETMKKCRRIGLNFNYIMSVSIITDAKNTTRKVLKLSPYVHAVIRKYLVRGFANDAVKEYFNLMIDMAVIYGANRSAAEVEMKEALEFEITLARASLSFGGQRTRSRRQNFNAMYNLMLLSEVQEKYPYVNWVDYINALLHDTKVDEHEAVLVTSPKYFETLGSLLEKIPKRHVANYVMWRIFAFSAAHLKQQLRKRRYQFNMILTGQKKPKPRWTQCVKFITGSLPQAVSALYIRKHFQESDRSIALEMAEDIRKEFQLVIMEQTWMDDKTKENAIKKLKKMTAFIGYSDELKDYEKLDEFYKDLEINSDNYFESILNIKLFHMNRDWSNYRSPKNKTSWLNRPNSAIIGAFYSIRQNSIEFPAAILQGKLYNANRPKYMNYGGIGLVIGHEITHGFDNTGRQFDADGNLFNWWDKKTEESFLERTKCMIEQYSNFTDETTGLKLDGVYTLGENIADNGGLKTAYRAYVKWAKENGPDPRLPGLKDYSPKQMFWISFGWGWCTKYRPEILKTQITSREHPPAEFRVLGPLRNMKDFAKDFKCPEGSPMNPVRKCEVW